VVVLKIRRVVQRSPSCCSSAARARTSPTRRARPRCTGAPAGRLLPFASFYYFREFTLGINIKPILNHFEFKSFPSILPGAPSGLAPGRPSSLTRGRTAFALGAAG
jgi:hypothetical protein